ncbi:unnamed protein product [Diabrotica balteata]|uniref:Cytochrome P450 n=1 Tax=Diabrotica balteata TaxID=107213 RepID=A0A9N9T8K1_DIABA|nr:unnamed protein product [Diabrotica balteata]
MIFPLLSAIVIITTLYLLKDWIRRFILAHRLPGPKGQVFMSEFQNNPALFFNNVRKWSKTYGPIYRLNFSYIYFTVNISGPEQLEKILLQTKNNKKGQTYKFVTRWLGDGLLTSNGTKWQKRRKILTPAFHFKMLEQFLNTFHAETKKLVNILEKETQQPWTNILPIISKMALLSITDTAMGISLNEEESNADQKYIATISQHRDVLFKRFTRPWLYRNFIYYTFTSLGRLEKKLISDLQSFTDNIIKERKKTFKRFEVDDETSWISSAFRKSKFVFLDILLNANIYQQSIDDQGIRDEVNTFTFEGHDTTSVGMCLTLMLLANHKDYQNRIYHEIIDVIGDNSEPDINQINKLKLMERFIKESLRLYPVLPFMSRKLEEDITIDGYRLPKGILINIHLFDVHRNEKYWPDPEKFDPDRFLPENCVNRHPLAYIPFSAGIRNCIGQKYAMLEIKAVLCGILRHFILEPVDKPETIQFVPDLLLRPHDKMLRVKFINRHINN